MSIKTFDNVYEFGQAISESPFHELRFRGKSEALLKNVVLVN